MPRLAALAAAAFLASCSASTAAVQPTPAPAASVAARIDHDVHNLRGTEIGATDLKRDVPLRTALIRAGMARRSQDAWVFTSAALRQSTACDTSDAAGRCFPLVAVRRLRTLRVVHHRGSFRRRRIRRHRFHLHGSPIDDARQAVGKRGRLGLQRRAEAHGSVARVGNDCAGHIQRRRNDRASRQRRAERRLVSAHAARERRSDGFRIGRLVIDGNTRPHRRRRERHRRGTRLPSRPRRRGRANSSQAPPFFMSTASTRRLPRKPPTRGITPTKFTSR